MRYDAKNGITIMLVDSDERFLKNFYYFLKKKLPWNITFAKNGTRALLAADKNPVHLFLMEVKMDKVDGFRMLELIRNDDKFLNVPVIFVSALRDKITVVKAKAAGVSDYLHKPIIPVEVLDRVTTFIKKSVNFKILVVDAEQQVYARGESIIRHKFPYNAEVIYANAVPAALEIIDTQDINLLILGNNMPVVSGVRMLKMLHDKEQLAKLAVVFAPEEDLDIEDRHVIAELGIEHYTEKPFPPDQFTETIMQALNVPPIPTFEFEEHDPD